MPSFSRVSQAISDCKSPSLNALSLHGPVDALRVSLSHSVRLSLSLALPASPGEREHIRQEARHRHPGPFLIQRKEGSDAVRRRKMQSAGNRA
jgi:hypothetical protein